MNQKEQDIALFKFKIIAPALQETGVKQVEYFKKMATKEHNVPFMSKKIFSSSTFKKWLHLYRKDGFSALKPSYRKDKGISRKLNLPLIEKIKKILGMFNFRTVKNLYDYLINEEYITEKNFTYTTLNNFVREKGLFNIKNKSIKRKAYESLYINSLWIVDFMYGPYVYFGKKKVQSYLCAIIDDYSRLIVRAKYYITMSNLAFELTLKEAISAFGICNKLYSDNGKVFLEGHLALIAAKLGFVMIHSKVGDAASRGKIERYFRTVRDRQIPVFHYKYKDREKTIENLNKHFELWLLEDYNKKIHSSIKKTPFDRYMENKEKTTVRNCSDAKLNNAFMHIIYRRVNNDSTVQINNILYEVPAKYINKKIQIRYSIDIKEYFLFENDTQVIKLIKLDKKRNSIFPIRFHNNDEQNNNKSGDNNV